VDYVGIFNIHVETAKMIYHSEDSSKTGHNKLYRNYRNAHIEPTYLTQLLPHS